MSIYGADIDHTRPRCAFVYPSARRCSDTATEGPYCTTHAVAALLAAPTMPAEAAQDAPGATNGPVGSQSAPNPQIALHRPEQENP